MTQFTLYIYNSYIGIALRTTLLVAFCFFTVAVFGATPDIRQTFNCFDKTDKSTQIDIANKFAAMLQREGYTDEQLQHRIEAFTADTPTSFLMQLRMRKAKEMLKNTPNAVIADVAISCGVNEPSNFSRAFKRHTGMTPKEFAVAE